MDQAMEMTNRPAQRF